MLTRNEIIELIKNTVVEGSEGGATDTVISLNILNRLEKAGVLMLVDEGKYVFTNEDIEAIDSANDFVATALEAADENKNYKYYTKLCEQLHSVCKKMRKQRADTPVYQCKVESSNKENNDPR